jgi:tetratricopeptide (TPR) repeat protein
MGYRHMRCLNWEEAVHYYRQLLMLLRPTENRIMFLYSQAYAAEAFLGSGLVAESMKLIDEAIDLAEFAQAPHLRALSRRVQAQAYAKLKSQEKAAAAFEEAIADLDRCGSRLELGRAHYRRAEMLFEGGQVGQARVEAERARHKPLIVKRSPWPDPGSVSSSYWFTFSTQHFRLIRFEKATSYLL